MPNLITEQLIGMFLFNFEDSFILIYGTLAYFSNLIFIQRISVKYEFGAWNEKYPSLKKTGGDEH